MPRAIAPSTSPAAAPAFRAGKPSPASLQAQLQRYQQKLSDCVNCPSANTRQGKADILSIAAHISQVRQSIAEIDSSQSARSGSTTQPVGSAASASAHLGSVIDVFA